MAHDSGQMEELEHARVSSGINYELDAPLVANAAEPGSTEAAAGLGAGAAGSPTRFQEGPFGDEHAVQTQEGEGEGAAPEAAAAAGAGVGVGAGVAAAKVPYYKRRKFWICQGVFAAFGITLLFVLLFPVVKAIAQHVVNVSVLNIDTAQIINPTNSSFNLSMQGVVTHTGIFNAKITFTQPVNVTWLINNTEIELGTMDLTPLSAKSKRATIDQNVLFEIADEDAFGTFTEVMITQSNFTWRLKSNGLRVNALKFPVATGIQFDKKITLNGINSFDGNVKLVEFQMPSDAADGAGINYIATTQLNNSSPFKVDLGTVVFNLTYNDTFLGQGTGTNAGIQPGAVNITLDGVLVPHNGSADELASVSSLFTAYLNGESSNVIAQGQSALLPPDNTTISWLSKGIKALALDVPFKNPDQEGALGPIKSITIGSMALAFNESDPWAPVANSDSIQAFMQLPFGFGLSIGEIMNSFNISQNASDVAGLSTPLGASTSDISVLSSTDTQGTINISIVDTALSVPGGQWSTFSQFNTDLTDLDEDDFQLIGYAHAVANLSIGQITLDPINFNVTSKLNGLRGLQSDTTIDSVDVIGGTTDDIILGINVSIYNPSNLILSTGDLSLQLYRDGSLLGTTLLPNLTLQMGNNSIEATGYFNPNASPEGQDTLNDFVGKIDVDLSIAGYDNSTNISSLSQAFKTLNLGATLPGLTSDLLGSTSLEVLTSTGITNNTALVTVELSNPFTAGLSITRIQSNVTSHGIYLGSINQGVTFDATGKSTTTSPSFELDMNLDPEDIFTLTRKLAVLAGEDTEQLDGIVALGGYSYVTATDEDDEPVASASVTSSASSSNATSATPSKEKRDTNIYTGFNLPNFVDAAFKQLRANIELSSAVTIGEYNTNLQYTQTDVSVTTDESLNYLLPILARPIVQKIVDGSSLGISTVTISDPQEESFGTHLIGNITNAGPFDANITFGSGLTITWSGQALGTIQMPTVSLAADEDAQLDVNATFEVSDVDHLTDFTKVLLTEESFEWEIAGENLTVSALGIDVTGINLTTKIVTLLGMNGLKNGVVINSFDLPANDDAGGIHLTLNTTVTNPAQVGIELSSIGFQNYYQSTYIGPAESESSFTLSPQASIDLPLVGRLVPQNDSQGLADVSTIFNNFIHGKDSEVTVQGDSAGPSDVTWLNEGIKSLDITTSLPNQGKLDIIKSISLNELELLFSTDDAYGPPTSSNDATAAFTIPFAFPIDIVALSQNITVNYEGTDFAELQIPKGPSTTDVDARIIYLTFNNTPFAVYDDQHGVFNQFLADTTVNANETFHLSGAADTDASTAIGVLTLTDIEFSVDTSIAGLQGLDTKPATVSNLDVNHGYSDYLLITVTTTLYNPSNLTIGTGDVSFELQFEDQTIGSAIISDAVIVPGSANYSTDVQYSPQGSAVSAGQQLLENFLQGVDSNTTIQGTMDTTPIESLQQALSEIKLSPVTIPALHQNLITSASLTFPTDIVPTGIADTSFTLSNPFTASINILEVAATVMYNDLYLGKIDQQSISFDVSGHSNASSDELPFDFNLNKVTIIELLLGLSESNGVDLGPLPDLFQYVLDNPDVTTNITTSVDSNSATCVSGQQFDVDDAILNDLKTLEVTLAVDSSVKLDDYATDLVFNQSNVTVNTDDTALYLIGAVAPTIVQYLVDNATLTFNTANITNLTDDGFDLGLSGSLTGTGPLDAEITFVDPVNVAWDGQDIATISLPAVCAAANSGVPDYETSGHLTITSQDAFTSFATYLLHNEEFTWTISTNTLRVAALGTIFDGVSLSKDVTLKAFNGLPGVTISNFELPGDDPDGGITISTDSQIPSPAQLGIELGTVSFISYFDGVEVGPLSGDNLDLPPESTVTEHLTGRIIPQSGSDLDTIGELFSEYLAGDNITLSVVGDSVKPDGTNEVSWLTTAFKTLNLSVILPGQQYKIIDSITINDLELNMTSQEEAYAPPASSQNTLATYQNPFGFLLQVIEAGENITIVYGESDVASLNLALASADGGVSTGNVANLQLSFSNQPLTSLNDGSFDSFFAAVTDDSSVSFELKGTANVVAKTSIGNVPISGIPFDVESSLSGINSFGGTATLSNVSVAGSGGDGGNQYIKTTLTTELNNPSNISLSTDDIALPVYYDGVMLGRAAISPFDLVPGDNTVATVFEYMPDDANDTTAQSFLTNFIQTGDTLDLTIQGDADSSPYASLQDALEGVKISTSLTGIDFPNLVTHINVYISLETLLDNYVSIDFDVSNPLDADLDIKFVQSDASLDGTIYAHFDQSFSDFVVPARGSANSGVFDNVLLTKGALASLGIIPVGELDISSALTVQMGVGGYEVPWLKLAQTDVPTAYSLGGLSLSDILSVLEGNSTGVSSAVSAATSAVGSVVSDVTSAVGSVVSEVTSAAVSVVSEATSAVGSVVSEATSVAGGVVSDVTSAIAESSGVVTPVTSAAGSIISDLEP